ncbi:hypothetical protein PANT_11c00064 [Moesziomyces antarcticus T-34]|uniref:Zn(2)-C6 fungal-type domain-containing protein n=1 Tax=Pseudozyma antarctica (strain T-34) TaxID=1151754 RepID=M9LW67_PSEA3|nr:hypothetical protein PANT_11c00064 [Moesziomyces antarcticus T-34]
MSSSKEGGGGKRKRVSRACDQCFLKKDRCDGELPVCTFCKQLERTCTYLRPERKRGPTQGLRPKLEQHIAALEATLGFVLAQSHASVDVSALQTASDAQRSVWRQEWLSHPVCSKLGLSDTPSPVKKEDEEHEQESDVDLALPPEHSAAVREADEVAREMPLSSSGKGGSSLRGLVPRGTDPNAALGGFEIQFGGNQTDEDWVRTFTRPRHSSSSSSSSSPPPRLP